MDHDIIVFAIMIRVILMIIRIMMVMPQVGIKPLAMFIKCGPHLKLLN